MIIKRWGLKIPHLTKYAGGPIRRSSLGKKLEIRIDKLKKLCYNNYRKMEKEKTLNGY